MELISLNRTTFKNKVLKDLVTTKMIHRKNVLQKIIFSLSKTDFVIMRKSLKTNF